MYHIKKNPQLLDSQGLLGGRDQIRTGVDGFADHCLATRPRDPKKEMQI